MTTLIAILVIAILIVDFYVIHKFAEWIDYKFDDSYRVVYFASFIALVVLQITISIDLFL